jgi:hypothetical protein
MAENPADDVLSEVDGTCEPPVAKAPAGSSKVFRDHDPTQSFLLPPSLDDWLPEGHTARFIAEVVDNLLDLSAIYDSYVEATGAPPYDPSMMLKLLLSSAATVACKGCDTAPRVRCAIIRTEARRREGGS